MAYVLLELALKKLLICHTDAITSESWQKPFLNAENVRQNDPIASPSPLELRSL